MSSVDFRRGVGVGILPTLGLVAAWCTLWMVWPDQHTSSAHAGGSPSAPRYVFLPQQEDSRLSVPAVPFPLPSEHGFSGALREDREEPESLKPVRIDLARVLKRPVSRKSSPLLVDAAALAAEAEYGLADYEPPSSSTVRVSPANNATRRLSLELSEGLLPFRPAFKKVLANESLLTVGSWSATAHVEIRDDGVVSHVFLETPTRSASLNSLVVRSLHRSCLTNVTGECEGQLILSWEGRAGEEDNP